MLVINDVNINLEDTITCGQCFRFKKNVDNSFTMILDDRVIIINQNKNQLLIESNNYDNLENKIINYFDLNNDYDKINEYLINKDEILSCAIKNAYGFKILKQNPFEMLISYIISQNNNVKRIMNSVEKLSKKYGKKISFNNDYYYLFPTYEELKNIKIEDLSDIGIGFRDKYIMSALNLIKNKTINLDRINEMNTDEALDYLELIKGVGPKVASCILLFAYSRYDVFPVDTWVIHSIEHLYKNVIPTQKEIIKFAKDKYGKYSGIALQYLYHFMRNIK